MDFPVHSHWLEFNCGLCYFCGSAHPITFSHNGEQTRMDPLWADKSGRETTQETLSQACSLLSSKFTNEMCHSSPGESGLVGGGVERAGLLTLVLFPLVADPVLAPPLPAGTSHLRLTSNCLYYNFLPKDFLQATEAAAGNQWWLGIGKHPSSLAYHMDKQGTCSVPLPRAFW